MTIYSTTIELSTSTPYGEHGPLWISSLDIECDINVLDSEGHWEICDIRLDSYANGKSVKRSLLTGPITRDPLVAILAPRIETILLDDHLDRIQELVDGELSNDNFGDNGEREYGANIGSWA